MGRLKLFYIPKTVILPCFLSIFALLLELLQLYLALLKSHVPQYLRIHNPFATTFFVSLSGITLLRHLD